MRRTEAYHRRQDRRDSLNCPFGPETPVEIVRKALRPSPERSWGKTWTTWLNVREAFLELFWEAQAQAHYHSPPFPESPPPGSIFPYPPSGRGIVICGGGWRFFASIYVTIRMIRHVGCDYPIQVWYLDETEYHPLMGKATAAHGAVWVNASVMARRYPRRRMGGWELKAFAAAYSPFLETLSLDADSYPVVPIEPLFDDPAYRISGSLFWPDQVNFDLRPQQWSAFGLPYMQEAAWESGQFLTHKGLCWETIWLALWLNDYSDYTYQHVYGDKETFHLAYRAMATPVHVIPHRPDWEEVAFLQKDFQGVPTFVHRIRDKFHWGNTDPQFRSPQKDKRNLFVKSLPLEEVAHQYAKESKDVIAQSQLHVRGNHAPNAI